MMPIQTITECFDPRNPEHMAAYETFRETGLWPKLMPATLQGATFNSVWQIQLAMKVQDHYRAAMLGLISRARARETKGDMLKSRSMGYQNVDAWNLLEIANAQLEDIREELGFIPGEKS